MPDKTYMYMFPILNCRNKCECPFFLLAKPFSPHPHPPNQPKEETNNSVACTTSTSTRQHVEACAGMVNAIAFETAETLVSHVTGAVYKVR